MKHRGEQEDKNHKRKLKYFRERAGFLGWYELLSSSRLFSLKKLGQEVIANMRAFERVFFFLNLVFKAS